MKALTELDFQEVKKYQLSGYPNISDYIRECNDGNDKIKMSYINFVKAYGANVRKVKLFSNFISFANHMKKLVDKKNEQKEFQFHRYDTLMMYAMKNMTDELYCLLEAIDEYYDVKFFTECNLKSNFVLARSKTYGKYNVGVMLKESSYLMGKKYILTVANFTDSFVVEHTANGNVEVEMLGDCKHKSIQYVLSELPKDVFQLKKCIVFWYLFGNHLKYTSFKTETANLKMYPTYEQYYANNIMFTYLICGSEKIDPVLGKIYGVLK